MSEDYPHAALELERRFGDKETCRRYLFGLQWSNGFVCPHCQASQAWDRWNRRHTSN
ncbi:MAG: hypothetical protein DRP83_01535 [Planctomycetota bacterium]|nr:MAG: hypothetical protein DRP83_01535 [Planctomycetota bacterium]